MRLSRHLALALLLAATFAHAQNPVPHLSTVSPTAVVPGIGAFTLSVYGANFVPGAIVNWNYQPRSTTFISAHELQAQILATDVTTNTAGMISVTNPSPGGGNSSASWVQVEVHDPVSSLNFEPVYVIPLTCDYTAGFLMADFTGSGILDMWADSTAMLGNGEGKFHFGGITDNYFPPALAIYADFNGDGKIDLAYTEAFGNLNHQPQTIGIQLGEGNGKFQRGGAIKGIPGSGLGVAMAAGDFNRDGKMDIVTNEYKSFVVYAGNGDGTFQQLAQYPGPGEGGAYQLLAGDFNGDGILDLVVVNQYGHIYLYIGKGDGTFEPTPLLISNTNQWTCGLNPTAGLLATDLNHDGKLDLLACGNDGEIGVFLGNGDGTFQSSMFQATTSGAIVTVLGDFNSDGNIDLLLTESQTTIPEVWVLWGNGDGTFQSPQVVNGAGAGELGMAAADLNSDGLLDYVSLWAIGSTAVYLQQ